MEIGDKLYKPVTKRDYSEAVSWCGGHEAHIEEKDTYFEICVNVAPPVTVQDYDDAMEAHLLAERSARGYTTREPDSYINSSVARWKQDALDWIAHKDAVMLYALDIENKYEAGEPVPTLEEFKAALPHITWTLEISES